MRNSARQNANKIKYAEELGRWLGSRLRYGRRRLAGGQVARTDAVCWLIEQAGGIVSRREACAFAAALNGIKHEPLNSLLSSTYGGVADDFCGHLRGMANYYKNYGSVAPLFRVAHGCYANTVGGIVRARHVESTLKHTSVKPF